MSTPSTPESSPFLNEFRYGLESKIECQSIPFWSRERSQVRYDKGHTDSLIRCNRFHTKFTSTVTTTVPDWNRLNPVLSSQKGQGKRPFFFLNVYIYIERERYTRIR